MGKGKRFLLEEAVGFLPLSRVPHQPGGGGVACWVGLGWVGELLGTH